MRLLLIVLVLFLSFDSFAQKLSNKKADQMYNSLLSEVQELYAVGRYDQARMMKADRIKPNQSELHKIMSMYYLEKVRNYNRAYYSLNVVLDNQPKDSLFTQKRAKCAYNILVQSAWNDEQYKTLLYDLNVLNDTYDVDTKKSLDKAYRLKKDRTP